MGLGGSIGTALFLGIGRALAATGPLSMFLGFLITGAAIWGMVSRNFRQEDRNLTSSQMQCLGEMTTWLPVSGALPVFASRFVDKALGFAVGWNVSSNTLVAIYLSIEPLADRTK